jgi:hypothetical protein
MKVLALDQIDQNGPIYSCLLTPDATGACARSHRLLTNDLIRLRQLVQKAVAKMDASRTEALLHAAAEDDPLNSLTMSR